MCSQAGQHWKTEQNLEPDEDSSQDYTIEGLELFRINMSVWVFHALVGNSPTESQDNGVNKPVDGLNVCECMVGASGCLVGDYCEFSSREVSSGGHRHKLYTDKYRRPLLPEMEHLS